MELLDLYDDNGNKIGKTIERNKKITEGNIMLSIAFIKNKEGKISIDKTGKLEGRGAYICNDIECLNKEIKTRKLEKNFEMKIPDEIYEELRKTI